MRLTPRKHGGVTLVELVMFIVLMGIAFGALTLALSQFTRASADPLIRKQALAIAESLLDEVALMPFTFCDPDDANSSTATNSTVGDPNGCATLSEDTSGVPPLGATGPLGPEAGESRGGAATPFDNVSDYNGFSMNPILDISNTSVGGLSGYTARVDVTQAGTDLGLAAAEAVRVKVTVTPPSGDAIVLDTYRTRYAPRTSQ